MTATRGRGRPTGPVLHPRICAVVTAFSCLTHLFLVAENHHGLWLNAIMLAMVAVCLPCTLRIWRGSPVGALRKVMASAVAMTALHAFLLLGAGAGAGAGAAGHSHGVSGMPAAGAAGSAGGGLLAIIALEIMTALLAATLVARLRPAANEKVPRNRCHLEIN
jgi:hypothetical protein